MSRRPSTGAATEGRTIFRQWRLGDFEYRHDRIAYDYMERWALFAPTGMVRLHHIMRGDTREHFHDHPMDFSSLILKGGYIEHRPDHEPRVFQPGDVVTRKAEDLHALEMLNGDAWTLVLAGPIRRDWGFATECGWIPARHYDAWRACKRDVDAGEAFTVALAKHFTLAHIELVRRDGALVARVAMPPAEGILVNGTWQLDPPFEITKAAP